MAPNNAEPLFIRLLKPIIDITKEADISLSEVNQIFTLSLSKIVSLYLTWNHCLIFKTNSL